MFYFSVSRLVMATTHTRKFSLRAGGSKRKRTREKNKTLYGFTFCELYGF